MAQNGSRSEPDWATYQKAADTLYYKSFVLETAAGLTLRWLDVLTILVSTSGGITVALGAYKTIVGTQPPIQLLYLLGAIVFILVALNFGFPVNVKVAEMKAVRASVPVQPKRESERSAVVKTPPCGRGFSRHRGLSIRWGGA